MIEQRTPQLRDHRIGKRVAQVDATDVRTDGARCRLDPDVFETHPWVTDTRGCYLTHDH